MNKATELEKRREKLSDTFNKEIENIKKNQPDLKNIITEIKKKHARKNQQ